MKVFYFDCETTGLDPVVNDITQLSGMIEIDNQVKEEFNFRCQPVNWEAISDEALLVTGIDKETLKTFPEPVVVYQDLINLLGKYVDKYDKTDKFYLAGYNVRFDLDFLFQFFRKHNDNYFGSWFNWRCVDPLFLLNFMEWSGFLKLDNYKLSTVCDHYGIKIKAHDAMSDITATRELLHHINRVMLHQLV